ncbi:hypothetical protein [Hymenobacter sp.]|uniref:hypothetical protein n=1 Tax=Hymenobacter sp. TaxID=1898978 RepID=UPI00286CFF8F|nr:hypothetical protein [Hymenobacter sp.]
MSATKFLYLIAISLLCISCAHSSTDENKHNSTQDNDNVIEASSDLFAGIKPAESSESLFVGDSENKVKMVLKSAIISDTALVLRQNTFFDKELNTNVKIYSLSQGGVTGEIYLVANDKLRNAFALMGKIKSKQKAKFISAVKKDFITVKKGVFKSKDSSKKEFAVFLMIEDIHKKKIATAIITGPNSNITDDDRHQYEEIMKQAVGEKIGIKTSVSFVE